jgi:hypothetical protein
MLAWAEEVRKGGAMLALDGHDVAHVNDVGERIRGGGEGRRALPAAFKKSAGGEASNGTVTASPTPEPASG